MMCSKRGVFSVVLALVLGLAGAAQGAELGPLPSHGYADEAPQGICDVSDGWFPVPPEADFVKPFDGNATNCDFHRWAVQEFLYLVQPEDGLARFLNLANPQSLFCAPGGVPSPYPGDPKATCSKSQQGLLRLQAGVGAANAAPRVVFLPRTLKGPNTTFDADRQAGSNALLIDQKGQIVYYTSQVDRRFYDFVVNNRYYVKDVVKGAAAEISFPVGAVEVKSAWRIAQKGSTVYIPDAKARFYSIPAEICEDKACVKKVPAVMAMVGLHVVGRVKNHPEMVWATFEHNDNVPNCNAIPSPAKGFSFFPDGDKKCGKEPLWEGCNQVPKDSQASATLCRAHPFGLPDASPGNFQNMQAINVSLRDKLPSGSIWKNYHYTSSVWLEKQDDQHPQLINLDSANVRGGKKAANTSLESFTQEKNCLHCHTQQPPQIGPPGQCFPRLEDVSARKNLYISHLFGLLCSPQP